MNTRTNHGAIVPIERIEADPYAEMKKAHAEGKVIECITGTDRRWMAMQGEPRWFLPVEDYRIKPDDSPPWIEWHGGPCPLNDEEVEEWSLRYRSSKGMDLGGDEVPKVNVTPSQMRWNHEGNCSDIIAYRVLKWREKKPKVPLGPEDVPPGSVIKTMEVIQAQILRINKEAVFILGSRGTPYEVTFEELQSDWLINRSIPLIGKWNPNAWEACEK